MGMVISHDMLLGRWRLSLELFGRVFMEDVGAEPGSVSLSDLPASTQPHPTPPPNRPLKRLPVPRRS